MLEIRIDGVKTVLIDYFNGDPVPIEALTQAGFEFDLTAWVGRHGSEATRPPIDKVVAALKEQGVKDFGATGYCFGGQYFRALCFKT